jgi:hypothetical protein
MNFLNANEHTDTLSEIWQVLVIVLVTPIVESRLSFSSLSRIKKFLRNSLVQKRLTALAILSEHKKYIPQIPEFSRKEIAKYKKVKISLLQAIEAHRFVRG